MDEEQELGRRFLGGMLFVDAIQFGLYALQDLHRLDLKREQASLADREEAARLRHEALGRLGTCERFSAGMILTEGPGGRAVPRRVEVAVTESEFVLLDAEERRPEERIARLPREGEEVVARIPRSEVTGVRLLDEHGEPVSTPPTVVQELDEPDRQYVIWVDRRASVGSGGHVFVFVLGRSPTRRGETSSGASRALVLRSKLASTVDHRVTIAPKQVRLDLESELEDFSLNCSACGLDVHWVGGLGVSPGRWAHQEPAPRGEPAGSRSDYGRIGACS